MTKSDAPLLLHVPGMQPELAGSGLPSQVRFLSPGLPRTDGELFWVSEELPFSPAEARACLNEMINLGEQFRNTRDLVTLALQPEEDPYGRDGSMRREMAELERFAATGESVGQVKTTETGEQLRAATAVAAQKSLILAWNLESRVHELDALQASFSKTADSFKGLVGVDEEDLEELPGLSTTVASLVGSATDVSRLSWRTVLDAMLRFTPDNAVFVTREERLVAALAELTEMVQPDDDVAGYADSETAGMYRIAAWTLLGHSTPPENRPWLDRELRFLVLQSR
ncbi:hypothetical protein N1030_04010 [Desulfovibrio mangrovi]|uniref:hypothetical protein n=1 Tax=Desulfovibrio mangrovi TaxID=2976983 RepID=UPI00224757A0|nr:hypothetical protein [Desulfovibrio mangrovi]UZP68150.1 hypothetical protein N1030_04010 [Desulfovibrio mangrovi]